MVRWKMEKGCANVDVLLAVVSIVSRRGRIEDGDKLEERRRRNKINVTKREEDSRERTRKKFGRRTREETRRKKGVVERIRRKRTKSTRILIARSAFVVLKACVLVGPFVREHERIESALLRPVSRGPHEHGRRRGCMGVPSHGRCDEGWHSWCTRRTHAREHQARTETRVQ